MKHPYHDVRKMIRAQVAKMTKDGIRTLALGGYPAMRDWLRQYTGGFSSGCLDYLQSCLLRQHHKKR